jgi:membrane protein DedA with SNARE-associated domain
VTSTIAHHSVLAVFVLMAIDAVFPAASELVMVYAGALASGALTHNAHLFGNDLGSGFWPYFTLALAGTLGYLVGSIGGWAIGLYGGRPFLERRGKWFHLSHERLERAERWFQKWEDWAVLVGRVTPVARSFVSIPAGVFEVPFRRYVVLTAIGSAVWAFGLCAVGWALGASWEEFHHGFRFVDYAIALMVVALAGYLLLRRRRSSTISRRGTDTAR